MRRFCFIASSEVELEKIGLKKEMTKTATVLLFRDRYKYLREHRDTLQLKKNLIPD